MQCKDFLLADAEAREVFQRQVDSSLPGVLSDIAQDICELQRMTEMNGIGLASGIATSENFYRNQPHRAGYAPAVEFQIRKRCKTVRFDIRGATTDDFRKKRAVDRVPRNQIFQIGRQAALHGI